ncbi:endonuclease V isoform X2 [Struthio camelus]|uniref:endonuclease V isoform X2 n=1 Tax=Struthio camelus TaxID=8801 RepID=UPI0036040746
MVAVTAPYIAGFLAFREVPFLVEAIQRLQQKEPRLKPQVLLVDGNGLLHHRGFGVACHLGVLTDLPCIGVAKNLLQVDGLARDELHREQIRSLQTEGDAFPLTGTSGKVLGMVLRSYNNSSKPLYISVGHRVCLETAVHLVKSCCRYRIPEPIRQGFYWKAEPRGLSTDMAWHVNMFLLSCLAALLLYSYIGQCERLILDRGSIFGSTCVHHWRSYLLGQRGKKRRLSLIISLMSEETAGPLCTESSPPPRAWVCKVQQPSAMPGKPTPEQCRATSVRTMPATVGGSGGQANQPLFKSNV